MKKIIVLLSFLLVSIVAHSQTEEIKKYEISFGQGSFVINPNTGLNEQNLLRLSSFVDSVLNKGIAIKEVIVDSYTSPEGGVRYNKELSDRRTNTIFNYLVEEKGLSPEIIAKRSSGIAWEQLADMILTSDLPNKEKIAKSALYYPEETWVRVEANDDKWPTLLDSRMKRLMDFDNGVPYRYIEKNFFPLLRRGVVVTIYLEEREEIAQLPSVIVPKEELLATKLKEIPEVVREPLFAVKTNLLFDIATVLNIELEIPFGERWSISGEWIFPWWVTKDNANALQMLSGQLEGRYWFGNRANKPKLTGWFGGLYAGGGLYDLQWKNDGYQGEFFIAAGLAGGYAHTINKSGTLRMEYSLGVGYLKTNYRYYEGEQDNKYLVWQYDGTYSWIGPTKAKVSLVWLINRKRGGKR